MKINSLPAMVANTPLRSTDRAGTPCSAVMVASDGYRVANVSLTMNDAFLYASIFAASPSMLTTLGLIAKLDDDRRECGLPTLPPWLRRRVDVDIEAALRGLP